MATDITSFPITTKKISERDAASTLDGTETIGLVQSGVSKKATLDQIQNKVLTANLIHVAELADFPTPSSGVITLAANTTYKITKEVDLLNNRLVASENTSIIGFSTAGSVLKSTGLTGNPLITSAYSLPMRFITLEAETPFALDATANPNQELVWDNVNLQNCTNAGIVKNYSNFLNNLFGCIDCPGITFDGTIGTIAFENSFFNPAAGQTALTFSSTLTITRRARITNSAFIVLSGETALNIDSGATIPGEGVILNFCNFAGGGTYLNGITESDNEARFNENRGIDNSRSVGHYYMSGNATVTIISATSTFVKVAGTTTQGIATQRFDASTTDNRAVYKGGITGLFKISAAISLTSGGNDTLTAVFYKNGVQLPESQSKVKTDSSGDESFVYIHDIVELEPDDYIEVFVANLSATANITVEDLNVIIE